MKEINLTLTKENELSFEKPEPYITINIANKETYEKLVDIIDKNDTPMEVDIEVNYELEEFRTYCPVCKTMLTFAKNSERGCAIRFSALLLTLWSTRVLQQLRGAI